MTRAVQALDLPVARCFGRRDLTGRAGVLFERIRGTLLFELLLRDPARSQEVAQTLAALQARLHSVSAPTLPRLRLRLANRVQQAERLSPAWRAAALRRLQELPDGDMVCHGDFHPGNVLLTGAGPVIIDLIDVSSGHPLADVARTVVLMRYGQVPDNPAATAALARLRTTFTDEYLAAYRALRPAPETDLAQWLPVIIAARLAEGADNDEGAILSALAAAFGPPG